MTLLFSMLRGCSESMPVPLNSRGSLVTQCHWYRMLKCNDESTSYGETGALYASYPSLRPKPISLTQRSPAKKKNATFKRERAAPRSQREGGRRAVSKHPLWPLAGRKLCACLPVCAQAQPQRYGYPAVKVKAALGFKALQTRGTLPGLPGEGPPRLPLPVTRAAGAELRRDRNSAEQHRQRQKYK